MRFSEAGGNAAHSFVEHLSCHLTLEIFVRRLWSGEHAAHLEGHQAIPESQTHYLQAPCGSPLRFSPNNPSSINNPNCIKMTGPKSSGKNHPPTVQKTGRKMTRQEKKHGTKAPATAKICAASKKLCKRVLRASQHWYTPSLQKVDPRKQKDGDFVPNRPTPSSLFSVLVCDRIHA